MLVVKHIVVLRCVGWWTLTGPNSR